jgi:hypothetical protein
MTDSYDYIRNIYHILNFKQIEKQTVDEYDDIEYEGNEYYINLFENVPKEWKRRFMHCCIIWSMNQYKNEKLFKFFIKHFVSYINDFRWFLNINKEKITSERDIELKLKKSINEYNKFYYYISKDDYITIRILTIQIIRIFKYFKNFELEFLTAINLYNWIQIYVIQNNNNVLKQLKNSEKNLLYYFINKYKKLYINKSILINNILKNNIPADIINYIIYKYL